MNCAAYRNALFASFDAAPDEVTAGRMGRHEAQCPTCRRLAAALRHQGAAAIAAPVDLVADVVLATSGSPCDRVQRMLAAAADTSAPEDELMRLHVDACVDCAAVERVLKVLDIELAALARVDPDERFVADVVAATTGLRAGAAPASQPGGYPAGVGLGCPGLGASAAPAPQRRSAWQRCAATWERLAQRPRIAMEGAYVAAAVVVLVGLPPQSFVEFPSRAFNSVRAESVNVERVVSAQVGEFAEFGRDAWSESTNRAAEFLSSHIGRDSPVPSRARAWAGAARDWTARTWSSVFAPILERVAAFWNNRRVET